MVGVPELTQTQFDTVYNFFSFAIASMLFTALFLLLSKNRVLPRYRTALVISAIVLGIATYHYFRIIDSFDAAYVVDAAGTFVLAEGATFNEAYRYVDWLLTVPLLLVEAVAVLALPRSQARRLLVRLVPASALMIALGYPGELAMANGERALWGALSTIPFLYILYVLFVELTRSMGRQPAEVAVSVRNLRWLLLASWGFYPIAYMFPMFGFDGSDAFVLRQVGYTIADVVAKAVFALVIYKIARLKSFYDDAEFARQETGEKMLDGDPEVAALEPATGRSAATS
ncbi:MAG: bacteriorhodopsin-like [Jiangellales bacterium]